MKNANDAHTIITHPGQAHMDDFLSCCLGLHLAPNVKTILRCDPQPEELDNTEIMVLDVGGVHDPERNCFDHHQLPRDHAPECALSLLAKDVTVHLADGDVNLHEALSLTRWYPLLQIMDSKGAFAAAKEVGVEPDQFLQIHANPLSGVIMEMFGSSKGTTNEVELGIMREIGRSIMDFAVDQYVRVNIDLPDVVKTTGITAHDGSTAVPIIIMESKDNKGLALYRSIHYPESGICVSYDDRGEGWSLYRFDDHPHVDLSKLKDMPEILYAHNGGFIAKTKERLPLPKVFELLTKAVSSK